MNLPTSLRVAGRTLPVTLKKDLDGAAGRHYQGVSIAVLKGQPVLEEADTLIHEAFHAVLYGQGRDYGGKTEELYVRALATGLVQLIRDNPEFGPWLASLHTQP